MKPPTDSHRRSFGVAIAAALLMLAWIAWRAIASPFLSGGLAAAALVVAMVYYLIPASQPKLIAFFHAITYPIRWTATLVVLAIVYYGVVTPISIWFRVKGKSIRTNASDSKSNWRSIDLPSDPQSYFRTF
ncbi:hypothetical protein NZK35_15540 [Stieleria sp. ICT_E10.1]|uniref:hypothetical protein n=1 Tax=Stieleria sedimenti TaxID=2976331 RepID=UPI00217FB6A1|nr:hypothetical protein [Stieleria sedimenti]MCS7468064.1 hypothetical protein [Stieleria sedimenti]